MNPENIPVFQACVTCISLEARTAEQHRLQMQCSHYLDQIAGLEVLMDGDRLPTSFPEMEL
jgi:hypothetical protein